MRFYIPCRLYIFLACCFSLCWSNLPKIAIIGGGIGGSSSAYFLNKLFKEKAEITLFERDTIGGRLNLINIDGKSYESGGSIIHSRNKHMKDFCKLLGLSTRRLASDKFGLFDGKTFVFRESDVIGFTYLKLLWRYGLGVFKLPFTIDSMLNDFSRIYEAQEKELSFTSVQSMLEYMNPKFPNMTQSSIASILKTKGFSESFVAELAESVMMVNYGQTTKMSAFAGFVSLAGAEENLFDVEGGNKLVPEGLLKASNATIVYGNVLDVTLLSNSLFSLKFIDIPGDEVVTKIYDLVILAAPLIAGKQDILFKNFKTSFKEFEIPFHRTVATFVKGVLDKNYFQTKSIPEQILTFNKMLLFNSVGVVHPVTVEKESPANKVYKVFSQKPLVEDEVHMLFRKYEMVKEKDWLAYPHYSPPEKMLSFVLHPRLYYINAIELSASAMEMSVIAAKNVALLAYHQWNNVADKVDQLERVSKDEL